MSGLFKGVFIVLALVLLIVVGAGVYLASNLNDLVRDAVEDYGPRYTGSDVSLQGVDLSLLSGEGELRGLSIANPAGFEGGAPFSLGRVRIALDPATLTEPVIVIREIIVEEAEINAIMKSLRESNLQTILDNVQAAAPASEAPTAEDAGEPIKVIIDRFSFTGGTASVTAGGAGSVNVSIPDLRLDDIGRRSNGETIGAALEQMIGPVVGAIGRAGVDGQLRNLLDGQVQGLQDRVRDATGGLLDGLPFGRRKADEDDTDSP